PQETREHWLIESRYATTNDLRRVRLDNRTRDRTKFIDLVRVGVVVKFTCQQDRQGVLDRHFVCIEHYCSRHYAFLLSSPAARRRARALSSGTLTSSGASSARSAAGSCSCFMCIELLHHVNLGRPMTR